MIGNQCIEYDRKLYHKSCFVCHACQKVITNLDFRRRDQYFLCLSCHLHLLAIYCIKCHKVWNSLCLFRIKIFSRSINKNIFPRQLQIMVSYIIIIHFIAIVFSVHIVRIQYKINDILNIIMMLIVLVVRRNYLLNELYFVLFILMKPASKKEMNLIVNIAIKKKRKFCTNNAPQWFSFDWLRGRKYSRWICTLRFGGMK